MQLLDSCRNHGYGNSEKQGKTREKTTEGEIEEENFTVQLVTYYFPL